VKLGKSGDARWLVGDWIYAGIGNGDAITRQDFGRLELSAEFLVTDARKYLLSKWLWLGVGISMLLLLPNVIWQAQHHFISLDFLKHLHERDVRQGRATDFWRSSFGCGVNVVTCR